MIIYKATKRQFVSDVFNDVIADNIDQAFYEHLGRHTSPNEVRSWKNSMQYMYRVVNTSSLSDDVGIAIEYQIPLTSKRVDFIISGTDSTNHSHLVVIELKQWDSAQPTSKPGIVLTRFQGGPSETVHPSYQAWSYAYMLSNYNLTIQEENVGISPCAYLHNYTPDGIIDSALYAEYTTLAPVFLKNDAARLQGFILKHINKSSGDDIIWRIDNGRIRPSKQLADSLSSMLQGNEEFKMIDDQKVVYETAVYLANKAQNGKKQVLIVEGGPGTGKSVLAVNLLVKFTNSDKSALYVTKNQAPRDVYTVKLSGTFKQTYIRNLFVGSGQFTDAPQDSIDALVVDEAHRLNLKSGLYANKGENQIKEIINAARFSVFFVDDYQRIHMKDIGNVQYIKECALELGADVHLEHLKSQFRCNGSDGYLSWIDNAIQLRETANVILTQEDFDFRVFDSPVDLFNEIYRKNQVNNKSRIVAGYCWDWVSKRDSSAFDIVLPEFNFRKQWNFNGKEPWLIGADSVNQIGCIHTCQGLELEYVGVIIGPDMTFRDGHIITDAFKRSGGDRSIQGFKQKYNIDPEAALQEADRIIRNTYRTLMTRGIKGCYVYCCDSELADHFRQLLSEPMIETQETRIEPTVNDDVKYIDFLPVFSIKAACGYFGEGEDVSEIGWIQADGIGRLNRNMFVVQAIGHSMEPRIQDGDYCVFRANPAGSRQGKIVLAQHLNFFDPDNNGAYSIKEYNSVKTFDSDGVWQHETIELRPLNTDYHTISIPSDDADSFRIVGEFIGTL